MEVIDNTNYKRVMVTTPDNPYDPFTDFDQWFMYDVGAGYNTSMRLASISQTSELFSDDENNRAINEAINELMTTGAISKNGKVIPYKKVYETYES